MENVYTKIDVTKNTHSKAEERRVERKSNDNKNGYEVYHIHSKRVAAGSILGLRDGPAQEKFVYSEIFLDAKGFKR